MTEKYKKNENYKQNDIYEFITSYRIALESNNKDAIHDAFTDIYNFIEKYVHQTLWHKYRALMNNPQHREEIIQSVWLKLFKEMKHYDPNKGSITTFVTPWITHTISEYVSKNFKKSSVYYANAMNRIVGAQNYCKEHGLNANDIKLLTNMTNLSEFTIRNTLKLIAIKDTFSYDSFTYTNVDYQSYVKTPDELLLECESEKHLKELVKEILNEEELKILELYLTPNNPNKKYATYKEIADKIPNSNPQKIKRKILKIKMKLQNSKTF